MRTVLIFVIAIMTGGTLAAQPMDCVAPPVDAGWADGACYILVRPGMIVAGDKQMPNGGFFLRLEADGAWRQVPMFYSEGADAENDNALSAQDEVFGPRW